MLEADRLRRLAARLAGDRPVDWDAQERAARTDAERDKIRQLRVVAAMAGFHRAAQAGDTSADLSVSVSLARGVAGPANGAPATAGDATPRLAPGTRWGHLEILERTGHGGYGVVYRARDTRLDRIVALKLLAGETTPAPDEVVREARLLAKVRHPHVVTVYGAERIDGYVGIWMEFVEGQTLDRILRQRGALHAREAALVGIDLCQALSAVHAAGIVHQDVKLGNVMRAEGGRIVLMDFGLGRETRPGQERRKSRQISGTPLFMAPEVLRGSVADVKSDVYSLGVVLFALVTGALPVEAASVAALLEQHARGASRRARDLRPDLPESFVHVLDRALAADPKDRFATPGEAERALLQVLVGASQPAAAKPRNSSVLRAAVVVLGAGLVVATVAAVLALRGAPLAAPRAAPLSQAPDAVLLGEGANDLFGVAVAGAGDVDQDGFDDVLVGAPQHDGAGEDRGKVYLYRGTPAGLEARPSWTAEGSGDSLRFGWSIASFTNLQMDGFADLVIGMHTAKTGRVVVYPGSKTGPSAAPAQTLMADRSGTLFGFAIATGDVNHDAGDDLLVGEPYFPDPAHPLGRVLLYLSQGDTLSTEPAWTALGPAGSGFGFAVSLGGDVNHDGYADALVAAPTAACGPDASPCGAAYVFLGSPAGLDSIPTLLPGHQADARFGMDAFIAGDVDGDGFSDVVLGAELGTNGEQEEGLVEIYFGAKNGIAPYGQVLLEANTMGANFGVHAGPLGDLDGDGCDDVFIGALRYQDTEPREGAAFVFSGARDRRIARTWFRAPGKAGSWCGQAGGAAGDVDADGFPDFILASPSWDTETGINVGRVELFLNTRK